MSNINDLAKEDVAALLCKASSVGNLEKVKSLIQAGADVNSGDYDRRTALHLAVSEGHLSVVEYLISLGANVNAADRWGGTPLQDAIRHKKDDIAKFLRERGAKTLSTKHELAAELCKAASEGDLGQVKRLVENGADVNTGDYDHRTALHLAASEGKADTVEFLLSKGAEVNVIDRFGGTPIQDASRHGHSKIVELLKKHGGVYHDNIEKIPYTPEFESSLAKALPMLCERGNWDYAEAWIAKQDDSTLRAAGTWYCDRDHTIALSHFRKESEVITFPVNNESVVGRTWSAKKPEWIEDVSAANDFKRKVAATAAGINAGLAVPVVYNDKVLAVLMFFSLHKRPCDTSMLDSFFSFACRLIVAGLSSLRGSVNQVPSATGVFHELMSTVYNIIVDEGVFSSSLVYQEVDWFFNGLGFHRFYFEKFPPHVIARHIHSLIAAKKLAQTSGNAENIQLAIEQGDHAIYICPKKNDLCTTIERKIEQYLEGTVPFLGDGSSCKPAANRARSLTHFNSAGTAYPKGKSNLSLYIVDTSDFVEQKVAANETDIWKIGSGTFLRDKASKTRERYAEVIAQASKQLSPVFGVNDPYADGFRQLMIAYRAGSTHSFVSIISDLMNHNQIECSRKYYEQFANGYVVISAHIRAKTEQQLNEFMNQAVLAYILPKATLTPLLLAGKITAPEMVYAHAVEKFAFYFINRQTEEFTSLSVALKNDPVNTNRLNRLQKRLRKEALTDARIAECITRYPDFVKECYREFAKSHTPGSNYRMDAATIAAFQSKIKKAVMNELDEQILSAFVVFNSTLLKTNFYKPNKAAVSFRFNPTFISEKDFPETPFGLFLVVGSDFRGFHVRFRDVARGGIRIIRSPNLAAYNRNAESLFDENYGLAHTQQKKNKDIPEGGSKGTILVSFTQNGNPEIVFKKYIDALLDLLLVDTKEIVDYYGKQEILFLGPDEGTADFMDWAALHARSRGATFWKAFTTGKSTSLGGIPHDMYGMTTRSIHQYVLGILRKLNIDEHSITKFQTGGPDGDLGSNEIKISLDKTIGVVDGSGVLYDPAGINREELTRLAKLRKPVGFFNKSLIGPKGFLVLVEDRDVKLPDGSLVESGLVFRNEFHLHPLSSADLFVPCGGRPEAVNISNVHTFFKEDGTTPRFKYVVEGANIFFTQDARVVLEKAGVVIYKDASANKGGVTSSSMEVLSALALNDDEFFHNMQVKEGVIPEFYSKYVEMVQSRIEDNARLEYECIDREWELLPHDKKTHRAFLSDQLSDKINTLNDAIQASSLWNDVDLRRKVLSRALPTLLQEKVGGLEVLLKRVPENYIRAIFGSYLASRYVYQCGLTASEFAFFEFMEKYLKN